MNSLHDVVVTTKVAIELAEDGIAVAKQAQKDLQTARERIQAKSSATLNKYQLL